MTQSDPGHIAVRYRRFAEQEAHGCSPLYEALATGVADSPDAIAFLGGAQNTNEECYLFQKAARLLGMPFVEHQARL